jgi:hypothetical protein
MARVTAIIHGIRDSAQARKVYAIIKILKQHDRCKVLDIIMISTPQLLRHVSNGGLAIMDDVYTLSVSGTGSIIYSGNPPASPLLSQVRIITKHLSCGLT